MLHDSEFKKILARADFLKEPLNMVANPSHINDHILIIGEPGSLRKLIAEILYQNSCYWKNRESSYYPTKNEFVKFFRTYNKNFYEDILRNGQDRKFINTISLLGIFDDLNLCVMVNLDNLSIKHQGMPPPPVSNTEIYNIILNQRVFSEYACSELNCSYLNNLRFIAIQDHNNKNEHDNDHLFAIKVTVPPLQDDYELKKTLINNILSVKPSITYDTQFFNELKGHNWNNIDELVNVLNIAQSNLGNETCLKVDHLPRSVYEPPLEMSLPDDFLEDETDSNKPNKIPASANKEDNGINHLPLSVHEPFNEISDDFLEDETDSNKPNKVTSTAKKEDNDKKRQVSLEIIKMAQELDKKYPEFRKIVSNDPIIAKLKVDIHKYAKNAKQIAHKSPIILFTGETGVGKELFAKAYHDALENKGKFVAFSMAALSPTLIKSELFGYVKGAFTGADNKKDKPGLFEAATDGTIFLDEFGELETDLQVKFLRVFEEREILPVGAIENKEINANIVLATNKNLLEMVKQKTFREDLYHRIHVTFNIPPLRERRDDIPLLIDHFLKDADFNFTDDALKDMQKYQWPGNVRELMTVIEKINITKEKDQTLIDDVSSFLSNKNDKAITIPSYDRLFYFEQLINDHNNEVINKNIAKKIPSPKKEGKSITEKTVYAWIKEIHYNKNQIQDRIRDKAALNIFLNGERAQKSKAKR